MSKHLKEWSVNSERDEAKIKEYFKKRPEHCNNPDDFLLSLPPYLACQEQSLAVVAQLFTPETEPSSEESLLDVNSRNKCSNSRVIRALNDCR